MLISSVIILQQMSSSSAQHQSGDQLQTTSVPTPPLPFLPFASTCKRTEIHKTLRSVLGQSFGLSRIELIVISLCCRATLYLPLLFNFRQY